MSAWLYSFFERVGYWFGYLTFLTAIGLVIWVGVGLIKEGLIKESLICIVATILLVFKVLMEHRKSIKKVEKR